MNVNTWSRPAGAERVTLSVRAGACGYAAEALSLSAGMRLCVCPQVGENDGILELRELHQREDAAFAYRLEFNGRLLYFRSYEPLANAPVSVFVRLPAGAKGTLQLTVETGTVRLIEAILHPAAVLDTPEEPMGAGFFTPRLTGDREKDRTLLAELKACIPTGRHLYPLVSFEIPYMNRSDEEFTQLVSYRVGLCREAGLPLYLNLNSWWGGTPGGPDGQGGLFGDMPYQQVVYDPETGRRTLSVPNMWSNTPWLTMNHPVLNEARHKRLQRCMQLLRRVIAAERAVGEMPPVSVFLDNEPTYWAAFAYTKNADTGGDVSVAVQEAAARDGITFPEKGPFSPAQREWLLNNLNTYIHGLASAGLEESQKPIAVVKDGQMLPPDRYLPENTYTHVFPFAVYPYMDFRHPQWETHVTPAARLGMETSTWEDPRIHDAAVSFGRYGNINAERACFREHSFQCQGYLYGSDVGMIFNYRAGDPEAMAEVDRTLDTLTLPEREYPVPVVTVDVFNKGLDDPAVAGYAAMAWRPYRNRRVFQPEQPGTGLLILDAGTAGQYGDTLMLELWGFVHQSNGRIRVLTGRSPEQLAPTLSLPEHKNEGDCFLTAVPLTGFSPQERVYVGLEITSTTFDADWSLLNYVWGIRLMRRHATATGHHGVAPFTVLEQRRLHRLVMWRADHQRLLAGCPPSVGNAGAAAAEKGDWKAACEAINQRWAGETCCEYYLKNEGPLGNSGLYAYTDRPVVLTLRPAEDGLYVTLFGQPDTAVRLKGFSKAVSTADGWLLTEKGGEVTIHTAPPPSGTPKGRSGGVRGGRLRVQTDHPDRDGWQPHRDWPLDEEAALYLRENADGEYRRITLEEIPSGAAVEAKLVSGRVTEARFTVGLCRGRVYAVNPGRWEKRAANATVTVETENGEHRCFELGRECRLSYEGAPHTSIFCCPGADPALEPGREVRVRYYPNCENGRCPRALEIEYIVLEV